MRASSIVRSVAGGVVLAAALAAPTAAQGPPPGSLGSAGQKVAGRSYGQWEARYFQWIVRHHFGKSTSPESRCIASAQTEPVWFLASNTGPADATSMSCAVPAGRYLMVSAPNVECSTVERGRYHASTDGGLRRCARRQFDRVVLETTLTVDGAAVAPVRAVTSAFSFHSVRRPNYLFTNRTRGRMAAVADAAIFAPFAPGPHTIVVTHHFRGYSPKTFTYKITAG